MNLQINSVRGFWVAIVSIFATSLELAMLYVILAIALAL